MKISLYVLVAIGFASCHFYYTEYVYELKRSDSQFVRIDDNLNISVDISPTTNKHKGLWQTASGPYLITMAINGDSELLDNIQIDNVLLIMHNNTIDFFSKDIYIYASSLGRNYYENEKAVFISSREIKKSQISSRDYILIGFKNVEIIYKDTASFEIVINLTLQYKDNNSVSKEIRYKFFRKKNSEIVLPST
jgi:hypothetical protein